MCISWRKIHCHPSLLRMQSVFRFPANITLLLSYASVFMSLQKPIFNTSAYFMFPMFFSYTSMSQETHISHRKHCSHSYFPFDFHATSLSKIIAFKNPLVYGYFFQCNSSMAIVISSPLLSFAAFLSCCFKQRAFWTFQLWLCLPSKCYLIKICLAGYTPPIKQQP